jgi:hypothetical protein
MPPGWCAPNPLMWLEQVIFPLLFKPEEMIELAKAAAKLNKKPIGAIAINRMMLVV